MHLLLSPVQGSGTGSTGAAMEAPAAQSDFVWQPSAVVAAAMPHLFPKQAAWACCQAWRSLNALAALGRMRLSSLLLLPDRHLTAKECF